MERLVVFSELVWMMENQCNPFTGTTMTINKPSIAPIACSVTEFCHAVSIGKTHFYAEVNAGRIKVLKSGRKTLVPISEQQAYLSRLAGKPNGDPEGGPSR